MLYYFCFGKDKIDMSRGDKAKQLFLSGYNCTQSLVMAFDDMLGYDPKTVAMIVQPLGTGIGGMREVCGTVSGMAVVIGILFGGDNPRDPLKRREIYGRVRELSGVFEKDNGSIVCRELLGVTKPGTSKGVPTDRPQGYKKRPCPDLAKYAADLLEKYIEEHKNEIILK